MMIKKTAVLFQIHKKKLPGVLLKMPGHNLLRLGGFIAIAAWIFQGMRYMDWRETLLKLVLDAFLIVGGVFLGLPWWLAVMIAHSLNFMFNGQLLAMFTHMGATDISPMFFLEETLRWAERLEKHPCVGSALAFGSLTCGEYKQTSDIDLRLVPAPGKWNFWCCVLLAFKMRCIAFIRSYPLDLYVFSLPVLSQKMRTDEPPVLLSGTDDGLSSVYPNIVSLNEFATKFRNKQQNKL